MNLNHFEAIQTVQKLHYLARQGRPTSTVDVSVHPPFTDIRSVQTVIEADELDLRCSARSTATGRTRARSPARCRRLFLAKLDVELRDLRPQRAARAVRRDRRDGRPEGRGDPAARDDADHVRRRDARRARGGRDRGARCSARSRAGLAGRTAEQVAALVIAYEPIWAIGTGRTATADDAQAVCAAIRGAVGASCRRRRGRRRPHPVRRLGQGRQRSPS